MGAIRPRAPVRSPAGAPTRDEMEDWRRVQVRFGEQALGRYLQLESKVVGRLEPLDRILLQTVPDGVVHRRVYGRSCTGKLRRVLMKDGAHGVRRRIPAECPLPGEQLVEDGTEAKD